MESEQKCERERRGHTHPIISWQYILEKHTEYLYILYKYKYIKIQLYISKRSQMWIGLKCQLKTWNGEFQYMGKLSWESVKYGAIITGLDIWISTYVNSDINHLASLKLRFFQL